MAETSEPDPTVGSAGPFDPDEAHEIASGAATTTFRHHPGAWMDALPAALDTYRTVFDGLVPTPGSERT